MKRMDTINVIPFIDIMLVLLAIVLTTATFIVEGRLEIRLPSAESSAETTTADRLEVAIDDQGHVFAGPEPMALAELATRLDHLDKKTRIVLRVDKEARFADFVAVVDLLKARALEHLTILTRER